MYEVLDLFSGIGGFSLGLERTGGFKTVAFCEIEPFCQAVLKKHRPEVPCYDDITTLTAERLAADGIRPDVLCGGFPCQPFSTAARGRNNANDLWPEMYRVISENCPQWVIAENVKVDPIMHAARQLQRIGYECATKNIRASDCGGDHKRNRWWLLAHANGDGKLQSTFNAEASKLPEICKGLWGSENFSRAFRVSNGLPNRPDGYRIRALGNAVVPQIPQIIGEAILRACA